MTKLGIVAGGGAMPGIIAAHCESAGRSYYVIRLKGFASPALQQLPGADAGIAEAGKVFKLLKAAKCEAVCLVGEVARPDFRTLMPDLRTLKALPSVIMAARKGDDALLRAVVREIELEGFHVEGAHEVMGDLTLPVGRLGQHAPSPAQAADIERAMEVARAIGGMDVGQGAVACEGIILAVEAQEGTDAMLRRVGELPEALRGIPGKPRGVLAKAPKPMQDTRIDLPTIGPHTLQRAAASGLAGVAGEAGKVLVVDRAEVVRLADELGLFVVGIPAHASAAE